MVKQYIDLEGFVKVAETLHDVTTGVDVGEGYTRIADGDLEGTYDPLTQTMIIQYAPKPPWEPEEALAELFIRGDWVNLTIFAGANENNLAFEDGIYYYTTGLNREIDEQNLYCYKTDGTDEQWVSDGLGEWQRVN